VTSFGEDKAGEIYVSAWSSGEVYRMHAPCSAPTMPVIATNNLELCEGDTAIFIGPEPPEGYGYKWFKEGEVIPEEENQELEITEAGNYRVQFVFQGHVGCNSDTSEILTVNFNPLPPVPEIVLNENNILVGPSGAIAYQWFAEGLLLEGENAETLDPSPYGSQTYTLELINEWGCSNDSEPLFVEVTATDEKLSLQRLSLFPMPFEESFQLEIQVSEAGNYQFEILDIHQRQIIEFKYFIQHKFSKNIKLDMTAPGLYILKIERDGKRLIKKVIKK